MSLKEHNDKIREKVQQMFLEDSISYASEKSLYNKEISENKEKTTYTRLEINGEIIENFSILNTINLLDNEFYIKIDELSFKGKIKNNQLDGQQKIIFENLYTKEKKILVEWFMNDGKIDGNLVKANKDDNSKNVIFSFKSKKRNENTRE
ncbi:MULTISPECIES: hypothetical protein [Fusobacterium]|jgi:hypothetical protein|uniref:Uncharacterized protein n=1 Tax=Fusobacterium nucleatum TaxID=851 RepID=A0A323TZ03_FUSNU|nr:MULTISPECIES: hypothetical protein [Fusobacterium]PCR85145.1 hypothetical protein CQA79_06035 [Fusobacterium nucleatum]PZA05127.1 hypothetical protein DNF10_02310 [Fusobacterium nucleatum]QJX51680.1 hypothetical protein HOO60_12350 [Fusobacterium nucleatum]HCE32596.1 hypothetical protein [Fusobacterium sp.]